MRKRKPQQPKPTTPSAEVAIASVIAGLNQRNRAIQDRIGRLNAEGAKLSAEHSGNERRKLELLRDFDGAAK